MEYNSTSQEYVGIPTLSKHKPEPKPKGKGNGKGRKRKLEEEEQKSTTEPEQIRLATKAMSILVCGLTKRFKSIIGYNFTDTTFDQQECADFISEGIRKLYEVDGLICKALVMDMDTKNTGV